MNVRVIAVLASLASLTAQAATLKQVQRRKVSVCVSSSADSWTVSRAETIAGRMFAEVGIAIEWMDDRRRCKLPAAGILPIQISTGTSDSEFPGALAYTYLHDRPHTEVFYNRVVTTVEPRRVQVLLAHVLAHEITHQLEDVNRHSAEGVMKAHWDEHDFDRMADKPLRFAPEDIDLILGKVGQAPGLRGSLGPASLTTNFP